MKSCTSCDCASTCSTPCTKLQAAISPSWSTSLRELSLGGTIEAIPSTQILVVDNTPFPELPELRPIESKILEFFYQDGYSYQKIADRLSRKKNYVKITVSRAKEKLRNKKSESGFTIDRG